MSNPSNLYAEKIFSEHPQVLWALDDKADYVSLILEEQRNLESWTIDNGSALLFPQVVDEPFIESYTSKLIGDLPTGDFSTVTAISPDLANFNSLNRELGSFAIGSFVYSLSPYISSIYIGYEYNDATTGEIVQNTKLFNTSIYDQWMFVSETFSIPQDITTARLVIKISYINASTNPLDYHFLVNGITFGQWAEEFNTTSLGTTLVTIPSDINLPTLKGVEAKAYGLLEGSGYYISDESFLSAKNSGVPIVYGSSNVTTIVPNDNNNPGLILPAQGFLNNSGKYNQYTWEMWLRINSDCTEPKRFFGPIGSDDGLYVNGPFIVLKIDNNIGSYYVGEWTRPMLVHIRITKDSASLLINGDQVIALNYITESLSLPDAEINGKSQDWVAFYAHQDVSPIEVDCVAVYPYSVSNVVAKRRFVYGQAVEIPETINSAYSGTSAFIDYPFSEYTNNYMYPDLGKWEQGMLDNLVIDNNMLSVPSYELPDLVFSSKNQKDFYTDNSVIQNEDDLFITLKPNSNWDNENAYIYFDGTNQLADATKAIYGTFKVTENSDSVQTLLRIEDSVTSNYFSIDILGPTITYNLFLNGQMQPPLYTADGATLGEVFSVGVNLDDFALAAGGDALTFFGNRSGLKIYVGGTKSFTQTFSGKIYNVGFCNARNFSLIADLFNENGVPVDYENVFDSYTQEIAFDAGLYNDFVDYILDGGSVSTYFSGRVKDHVASYTLVPANYFGLFSLDIDVSSYWEDNIPLTYFAKYITDRRGKKTYDLDFIQFNLDYPAPSKLTKESVPGSWSYAQLQTEYANPIQRDYSSLDNQLYTGYLDYEDLQNNAINTLYYDTTNSLVRSYITFQYTATGANAVDSYFINKVTPKYRGVVKPTNAWINTKYEVVDNTIIYPPKGINKADLSLVMHLDFKVHGILNNKVKIKKMQLASQALDESTLNTVGTRFGTSLHPYTKSGVYYDYKSENPFSIYKGSSPYLYLTRYSGIQVRGNFDPIVNRGIAMPINSNLSPNYQVMAMQIAVRYDEDLFSYAPTQIFEIESKGSLLKFYMKADSPFGERARIYAINANTGQIEDGIAFYLNGNLVREPVISIKQWAIIGFSFASVLNFNSFIGSFKINGPLLVNLISHYQSTNLQEVQNITRRPWFKVHYAGPEELDWQYWYGFPYVWQKVLVLSSTSYYGVKPSDIYKSYSGTNKIIVDDYNATEATPKVLSFGNYEYNVYSDINWQSTTLNAV